MRILDVLSAVESLGSPVVTTREVSARLGVSVSHTSVSLARLASANRLIKLRHGVWALPGRVDPLALPAYLTAPFPAYVSLQSALYVHGMISQLPALTYAVSLARTCIRSTPLGDVSIHHVQPAFFVGFERIGLSGACLATPEKALVDVLYFAPARSGLFRTLPELEWPASFRETRARAFARQIRSRRRRTYVETRLARMFAERRR